MRVTHRAAEIEVLLRREVWRWMVFDEDGEEMASGAAQSEAAAFSHAKKVVSRERPALGLAVNAFLSRL